MKKMLFLSLAVMLFAPNVWADCGEGHQCWTCGASSNDCYADFDPDTGHLEITGNGRMTSYPWNSVGSSIVSANINGVENIAGHAFHGSSVQEVTIGDSVTSIESCAFNSAPIRELVVPSSVQSVGDYAFHARSIGKVYCPSHLDCLTNQGVGDMISYDKVGTSYQIDGKTYETVEDMKKSYCPEGHQCWNCGYISANCKGDFDPETGHLEITGNGEMTSVPWNDVKASITSLELNGITSIAVAAFTGTAITEVEIPDTVTSIGGHSFRGTHIEEIVIPDTVQSLGDYAFWDYTINTVYCPAHLDHSRNQCNVEYDKVGSYYQVNGKMYHDLDHMLKGIEMKRIYTISEALEATQGKGKNSFSIRYR